MNIIVTTQIPILMKTLIIYTITIITIIGIIIVVRVKGLSFDAVLEKCLFVYLTLGYVTDEWIVMTGK